MKIISNTTSLASFLSLRLVRNSSEKKDSRQAGMNAPRSVHGQRGDSPLQADALRPVTERNCVAARWGGEQREVNNQSVG